MLRYPHDWLILASSREEACWARDKVLAVCLDLGILVNLEVVDSFADHRLSGDQDRVADFPGFADSLEDRKVLLNSRRISVLKGAVCEVLEGSFRPPHVVHSAGSRRSPSDEVPAVGPQIELVF